MDEIENAEIALSNYDQVDFRTDKIGVSDVAADLVYIMENAVINEEEQVNSAMGDLLKISGTSDSESDSDSSDSDSDVKIIKVQQKTGNIVGETICIDSSDDNEEQVEKKRKNQEKDVKIGKKQSDKPEKQRVDKVQKVVNNVLKRLVFRVDRICNGEVDGDDDDESMSSDDQQEDIDRFHLAKLLNEETRVENVIPKVRNEILPEELPEEEENIVLQAEDTLVPVGVISGVVETMVVIEADLTAPALDADTAFFLNHDTFIGKIFDTFGPVKNPFYTIRLSKKLKESVSLTKGMKVYFVPFNKDITQYVFVEQLKKMKGSDASWQHDCEPPVENLDYSDDEEERRMKRELRVKKRNDRNEAINNLSDATGNKRPNNKPKKTYQHQGNSILEHAENMKGHRNPSANQHFNQNQQTSNASNSNWGRQLDQTDQIQKNVSQHVNRPDPTFPSQVPLASYYNAPRTNISSETCNNNRIPQNGQSNSNYPGVMHQGPNVSHLRHGNNNLSSPQITSTVPTHWERYSQQAPYLQQSQQRQVSTFHQPSPTGMQQQATAMNNNNIPPTSNQIMQNNVSPYLESFVGLAAPLRPENVPSGGPVFSRNQPTRQFGSNVQRPPLGSNVPGRVERMPLLRPTFHDNVRPSGMNSQSDMHTQVYPSGNPNPQRPPSHLMRHFDNRQSFEEQGHFIGQQMDHQPKFNHQPVEQRQQFNHQPVEQRPRFNHQPVEQRPRFDHQPVEHRPQFSYQPAEQRPQFNHQPMKQRPPFNQQPIEHQLYFDTQDHRPQNLQNETSVSSHVPNKSNYYDEANNWNQNQPTYNVQQPKFQRAPNFNSIRNNAPLRVMQDQYRGYSTPRPPPPQKSPYPNHQWR